MTKGDVLGAFDEIKMCTAYELDGRQTDIFPNHISELERLVPVYESMPGWKSDISTITSWDELPEAAKAYFDRLADLVGVPVSLLSVGPGREQTIECRDPFLTTREESAA